MEWHNRVFKWLKKNWDKTVVVLLTVGFALGQFLFPKNAEYTQYLIITGIITIFWLLIDLKSHLINQTSAQLEFQSLTEASRTLIKKVTAQIQKTTKGTNIYIIGCRLRTVSSILREVNHDIAAGKIRVKNCTFHVLCMNPEFVTRWETIKINDKEKFNKKLNTYSKIIKNSSELIQSFNDEKVNRENNIVFNVKYYNSHPYFYAFIINENELFWGHYLWDDSSENFTGSNNPCYYVSNKSEEFQPLYYWLMNRIKFFSIAGSEKAFIPTSEYKTSD